jgi:solute carrier family 25 (mitochondrial phosphate transporter), member 3
MKSIDKAQCETDMTSFAHPALDYLEYDMHNETIKSPYINPAPLASVYAHLHDTIYINKTTTTQINNNNNKHDFTYYSTCALGGFLSSTIRWIKTPLDAVKCNMQVHPHVYKSLRQGLQVLHSQGGLYRGLGATVAAYGLQSSTKYGMYEFFKDEYSGLAHQVHSTTQSTRFVVYLLAAASAETIADVLMCPWESLKVHMQTNRTQFPSNTLRAIEYLTSNRHLYNWPFASLPALLARQIPATVANFMTFEASAEQIYKMLGCNKRESSIHTQLGVTLAAGGLAGIACTIVSHPADSLLSLSSRYPGDSWVGIVRKVGLTRLWTQGLVARMSMTGPIIAFQWWTYDAFKTCMGLGTSGGGDVEK